MVELIGKLCKDREASGKLGNCVLDNCIKYNKKYEIEGNHKAKMTLQEIVGNVNIFVFAGTDTTQNTTKATLCRIADKPEHHKLFYDINKRIYDRDSISTTSQRI